MSRPREGGQVHATCDIYGQVVTKGKKQILHVFQLGITVTAGGVTLPAGMWDGDNPLE